MRSVLVGTDLTIKERVEKGARFLDRLVDEWPSKIDLATLDVKDPRACLFGQLFGSFCAGSMMVGSIVDDFPLPEYGFNGFGTDDMDELTDAWRTLIALRRLGPMELTIALESDR